MHAIQKEEGMSKIEELVDNLLEAKFDEVVRNLR